MTRFNYFLTDDYFDDDMLGEIIVELSRKFDVEIQVNIEDDNLYLTIICYSDEKDDVIIALNEILGV